MVRYAVQMVKLQSRRQSQEVQSGIRKKKKSQNQVKKVVFDASLSELMVLQRVYVLFGRRQTSGTNGGIQDLQEVSKYMAIALSLGLWKLILLERILLVYKGKFRK
ncbi:hypothetical protein AVEN_119499-1 [Araneus ventricosus]|uniref:Uncharacterized protein n=1 Tax=Araneus ventricosus TaxID=182803 RepID=A0A4Y2T6Z1_ARAVE|nr:hypothetical protein AVEN_119499-1 [Araneus ventricosus]